MSPTVPPFPDDDAAAHVPTWRRYVRFWGARVGADVDDELAFHVEMRVRDYVARGMSERDARSAATRRLGNTRDVRNTCLTIGHRRERRMRRAQIIDAFMQDVHYALRTLNRQRSWAAVAILTIALGIGASTAVFSVVNSLLLRPLPYKNADRVAMIWRVDAKSTLMISPNTRMIDAWSAQAHSIDGVQTFQISDMTLTGEGEAAEVHTAAIKPEFAAFTGISPILGRAFMKDDVDGTVAPVMLSEGLWRERFAGSRDVIGKRVTLNDKPYTVVGVVPSAFRLPTFTDGATDAWLLSARDTLGYGGMTLTRLRPGVTPEAASKELDAIVKHAGLQEKMGSREFVAKIVKPADMVGFKTSLLLLAGAVALLLLVACANVAHLLLARGASREREMAIRIALGAGRRRIARQLLTESLVLATAGCVAGIAIAFAGIRALLALRPQSLNQLAFSHLDGRAMVVAVVMSVVTGLVFGLTAALHAVRRTTSDSLRATSSAGTGAARTHALRSFLVVTEMALSAVLLVGAVLLTRSVIKLQHIDPGFDAAGLYSMHVSLPESRYSTGAARKAFLAEMAARARLVPGVAAVTVADAAPPQIAGMMMAEIQPLGGSIADPPKFVAMNHVDSAFFRVSGIRIVDGTTFSTGAATRNEVIINEGLAKRLWPHEPAAGHRIVMPTPGRKEADAGMLVVGVAANIPTRGLTGDASEPVIYYPAGDGNERTSADLVIRTRPNTDPVATLRAVAPALDHNLAPPPVKSVEAALRETISSQRFTMTLLAIFAGLAVVLSAVGLYGVIAYVVTQRTREIGIRIALGATPRHVARAIVSRGLILSMVGLAVGLTIATWGNRVIKSALYGVTGTDPLSYAATALLLLAISVAACILPTRRALAVDPVIAMRGD